MTLAAPRSRQSRFMLALAIVAALVAVTGALVWASSAQAELPTTVTELDQSPDGGGSVAPGDTVTYVGTVTLTADLLPATDKLILDVLVDTDLFIPNGYDIAEVVCSPEPGAGADGNIATQFCRFDGPVLAGTYSITITGIVTGSGDIDPPTHARVCSEDIGDGGWICTNETGLNLTLMDDDNPQDVGTLTNDPGLLVDVDPLTAVNFPGTPHTVTFTLDPNIDCASGENANPNTGQDDVTCDSTDVNLNCSNGSVTLDSIVVTDSDTTTPTTVEVTIVSDGTDEATCTVSLELATGVNNGTPDDNVFFTSPEAEKIYSFEAAAGELRHRDPADAGSEDAAGTTDEDPLEDWCDTATDPCGILVPQDDADDATGSFHEACIINTVLTSASNPLITWDIVAVSGSPLPTAVSITKVAGPQDEPCVRWSTGFTGTQNITAVYENGVGPSITYYWDGYCIEAGDCINLLDDDDAATGLDDDEDPIPLPLVKEWNDIDSTKIVAITGVVGDTLGNNTLGLADWANRDCSFIPAAPSAGNLGYCDDANLDGLTMQQEAAYILNSPLGVLISAPPRSFLDYTFGNHADAGGAYDGPVDGAEQTYVISGDCGSVRVENPSDGSSTVLSVSNGPTSVTVLTSDKGVGFTFYPTDDGSATVTLANADCGPLGLICIDIFTEEDNLFRSPPIDDAAPEQICLEYTVGPPTDKTPILAWAGQRVILEHYWGNSDGTCPEFDAPNGDPDEFGVLYSKQAGSGSFTSALQANGFNDVDQSSENVIVDVDLAPTDDDQDGVIDANSGCISRVIYESEDESQVDVSAYIVDDNDNLNNADPRSQQVAFVIYYLKFEDLTLGIVPGSRSGHNSGDFSPASPIDPSTDVTDIESNVSADVLVRARVRGWVETTNCPARDSGVGANGEFLPANRCIFPDDWRFKAGGNLAEETRPNFDVLNTPPTAPLPGQNVCSADPRAAGPFSLLDTNVQGDITANVCGDSLAPNVDPGHPCLYAIGYSCRETVFPNGIIDMYDANMPPALLTFHLTGSGFLHGADKDSVYTNNSNLFYATHIPAEPYLAPINFDLSGYSWNSWGGPGAKAGQYDYWDDLADTGPVIPDTGGIGYALTRVYTDNHGEAMTWVNGDANLTYDDCDTSAGTAGNSIVLLSGFYCEEGEVVGSSTIGSYVDYPDKRKHFAIESNDVTITWTWGGIKYVTIEAGEGPQFNYVVLHLTDRDGFCDPSPSLNPVIGEQVLFVIDSPNGIIFPDVNGIPAALLGTWSTKAADVTTFDTDGADSALTISPVIKDGECQAWIHVSESLLQPVNVIITAFDPEGTVTFDVVINAPTPTPAPTTPTPTPANQLNLWADVDCDDDVNPIDSLKVLRADAGLSVSQESACPAIGTDLDVIWDSQSTNEAWGDADCNNSVDPVDSLKILRFDAGLFYIQQEPCPDIGQEVRIPAQ